MSNHNPEIMALLERFDAALNKKDLDALAKCYDDNVRVFDVMAQVSGYGELRSLWEHCFPYFTNPIEIERRDIEMHVNDSLAIVTFYSRVSGVQTDSPAATSWLRTTMCMKKIDGAWKIVHDHISFPVNCETEKPAYIFIDDA